MERIRQNLGHRDEKTLYESYHYDRATDQEAWQNVVDALEGHGVSNCIQKTGDKEYAYNKMLMKER